MKVGDALARRRADVRGKAIAGVRDPLRSRNAGRGLEDSSKQLGVVATQICRGGYVVGGDDQDVGRCHRIDVAEGDEILRSLDDVGGDLLPNDLAEKAVIHTRSLGGQSQGPVSVAEVRPRAWAIRGFTSPDVIA